MDAKRSGTPRHRQYVYEYIAVNSTTYASRMVDKITRRSIQIADFPYSGRETPEYEAADIRELIEYPYRLIYRIKSDKIDILAVVYGARQLPDDI